MKKNILIFSIIDLAIILLVLFESSCTRLNSISAENDLIKIEINPVTGALIAFTEKNNPYPFYKDSLSSFSLWEIEISDPSGLKTINISNASRFRHWKPDQSTLILEWDKFKGLKSKDFAVTAIVELDKTKSMSYWSISLDSTKGIKINKLAFPRIKITKTDGEEYLAVPEWMGQLMKNPRNYLGTLNSSPGKFEWSYPGPLSMQCAALYTPGKRGFYASCNDTLANRKNMAFILDSAGNLVYQMNNFPATDTVTSRYETTYSSIIGSFTGDWITAAEIYRDWGSKQKWSRESRFNLNMTPQWLEKTALWVWNRGRSSNVLVPASDLQRRSDLPVSVFWHWWHGCSYDDGFPEYIPPREGKESFISAMSSAHDKGINAIVYMNQALWGTTTASWRDEEAEKYAAMDSKGNTLTHIFNIFTGRPTAYMCMGTQFWKDKYSTLCDSAVNTYKADGVYMDMACLNTMCFNKSHGHPVGGGNYHIQNFGKMADLIRSKIIDKDNLVLAGEGAGEVWMPYLDLFLTLAVSKERYAGPGAWETIPFFQAVYHQYAITYGNYSSLLIPPYDELWPKKYAPAEPLKMLDKTYNRQFLMEQARSFVWGLQPTISNYQDFLFSTRKEEIDFLIRMAKVRNSGMQYLLNGKFLRTPHIDIPVMEFDISRLSIYAGKMGESVTSFKGTYPLIYAGTWKAENGDLGIAIASISNKPFRINMKFNAIDYDLTSSGSIYLIDYKERKKILSYSGGNISVDYTLNPEGICIIEVIPDK